MRSVYSFLLLFSFSLAVAQDPDSQTKGMESSCEEDLNCYLNHLDSFIINLYYKKVVSQPLTAETDSVVWTEKQLDSLYALGLSELDRNSPFDFAYNRYTKAFINLYLYKKRDLTERCMSLSEYYFPIFEEYLDKYDLPMEFKYLAIVESALNIKARSRAGAAGLWQFMYRTGKVYGLEVNSYIDERYELYQSTDAACHYFRDLYDVYGNWELVIAAYNCGPGNVNKAIRRSGGKKTYWEIRRWLPRETRGYVPAFIAVNYAMNYGHIHGLKPANIDSLNLVTDTVRQSGPLEIQLLSQYFCTDLDQLLYLNPQYKLGELPGDNRQYTLRLPVSLANAYLEEKDLFQEYSKEAEAEVAETVVASEAASNPRPPSGEKHIHVVQSGEVLGVIAEKYDVGLSRVKAWNNLYSSRIYEGQKLVIYSDKKIVEQPKAAPLPPPQFKALPGVKYHTVKSGDTLWDIAKLYDGMTVTELKRLNSGLDHRKLKPGMKIIVSQDS